MNVVNSLLNNKYILWIVLSAPCVLMIADKFINGTPGSRFFYWTGVISMILIFVTLAATPLLRLSGNAPWARWLMKQRRYLGVASFVYMAAHTAYWMQEVTINRIVTSLVDFPITLGWISGAILAFMAMTSNDYSVRELGEKWKTLQKWVYIGAPLALFHWLTAVSFATDVVLIYGSMGVAVILLRVFAAQRSSSSNG